ncbi:MAG: transposase [Moorea sp. SIO4A5]|nr:transposase [Moorena sp. SIO4A5]
MAPCQSRWGWRAFLSSRLLIHGVSDDCGNSDETPPWSNFQAFCPVLRVNGIFYVLLTGCSWEMMPKDLPPSSTVYSYFRVFERKGVWKKINQELRRQLRTSVERQEKPSAGSNRFSISENHWKKGEVYGNDCGKRVKGRKRHILVDEPWVITGSSSYSKRILQKD